MIIKKIPLNIDAEITVPGDKSISHRAVMISSLARGKTEITNFLNSEDTLTTLKAFKKLGADIKYLSSESKVLIKGKGKFLIPKSKTLYMAESGTTIRLISGILAGQKFQSKLITVPALKKRPMRRIILPLKKMGAVIFGREKSGNEYPPLHIKPVKKLTGIKYKLPVASAQVKSCILFSGLYAEGRTEVIESYQSRDHTERMLKKFNAHVKVKNKKISLEKSRLKTPNKIFIPSDFSSACFFIVLGLLLKKSRLKLKHVSVNPTRSGLLKVLKRMGADIKLSNVNRKHFEPFADITAKSSQLNSTVVKEKEIPILIDELPLLFVAASFAKGKTVIYGLRELKVKETDRLNSMGVNLKNMGVKIKTKQYQNKSGQTDWLAEIQGAKKFKSSKVKSFSDHRTAMSMLVAVLALGRNVNIDSTKCISKSFPGFLRIISEMRKSQKYK